MTRPRDTVHLDRAAHCSPPEDQGPARTHDLHLLPDYHALVANGTKTVEVRTAGPAKALIRPGDRIVFRTDHDRPVTCEVLRVDRYSGFDALLDREDPATIDPAADRDSILAALRGIYPPAKEELGALAIEVVLLVAGHP
ncbi:ASCH domain-containing protein [Kitasatospora purpeofusca]|uniref:ASCH domain-containing protein n=1 Tax=Kitasatospora purpeofusca TaxID=67352 RepID=UPI00366897ED